jgi:hypothetical protein
MTKRIRISRSWTAALTGLGLAGACTVVDKGDYTFTDDPDDGEGGEGSNTGGKGGSSGSSNGGTGKGGASGSGTSGDAGDGSGGTDTGGTSAGGTSAGGTSAGGTGGAGDECDPNPCDNDGTCIVLSGGGTKCDCAAGYTGETCKDEIDECDPNPCVNNAPCTDKIADFSCSCPPEVTGKSCELLRFEPIPGPGGVGSTRARAVSADGTVVIAEVTVPFGATNVTKAFVWSVLDGSRLVPLPSALRSDVNVVPLAISGDGTHWAGVFFGSAATDPPMPIAGPTVGAMMLEPNLLEQTTGNAGLPLPMGAINGFAVAMTGDGSRAVGRFTDATNTLHGIRWNDQGMALPFVSPFAQGAPTTAGAVTRDGTIAAGTASDGMGNLFVNFWAEAGATAPGMVRTMTGISDIEVHAMSENARYTVGTYRDTAGSNFAFVTDSTRFIPFTMTSMPVPPRGNAWDVSDDGAFIAGDVDGSMAGMPGMVAVIWKPDGTFRPVVDILRDFRVTPAGWVLQSALGISADGRVVVGQGVDPMGTQRGFIARL